ncbi:hypothetical protein RSAG8_01170, partial [Rhizoctonia solani AG-8 WAC10335]
PANRTSSSSTTSSSSRFHDHRSPTGISTPTTTALNNPKFRHEIR